MIDSQILSVVVGVSTPLGFLSLLAYFYFLQQVRRNEQSVREAIEGEGLFNASHVLKILEQFKDDSTRLQALETLTDHDQTKAKGLLEKLKRIDIAQLHEVSTTHYKQVTGWSVLFFFALALVALAYSSFSKVPIPNTVIERTYRFAGPFKATRTDNMVAFSLTEAIQDEKFSKQEIRIESATVTGEILNESDEPFGFDQEILVFSNPLSPRPRMLGSTDYGQLLQLHNGYAPPRRLLQLTLRTDASRAVHSQNPIHWTVNVPEGSTTAGDLKVVRDAPITVGSEGLFVQLFLWTLWGGEHFIEFRNFEVKLKIRTSARAT